MYIGGSPLNQSDAVFLRHNKFRKKGPGRDNSRAEALFLCAVSVHFTMP